MAACRVTFDVNKNESDNMNRKLTIIIKITAERITGIYTTKRNTERIYENEKSKRAINAKIEMQNSDRNDTFIQNEKKNLGRVEIYQKAEEICTTLDPQSVLESNIFSP